MINEYGLYVHESARSAIEVAVREQQVGHYPVYLVGLALREHRHGPAVAALLTLPDGGVLDACARSLHRKRPSINKALEEDVHFLDAAKLERYRTFFYEALGGFSSPCLDWGPTAAAEGMLRHAFLGAKFGAEVGPSSLGPPGSFPSDWTDIVWYSSRAVGCAVEGFTPTADQLESLTISSDLKRAMSLPPSESLGWLIAVSARVDEELHPRIVGLIEEAWTIRIASAQASVALLRSAAELIAAALAGTRKMNFYAQLNELESAWQLDPPDRSPAGRRVAAWRTRVLAHLHTIRDIGNSIHADSAATATDVAHAHAATRDLLDAVLRTGRIDGY